jgi:citrate synthase
MTSDRRVTTAIAHHDAAGVNVRGYDLVGELVGEVSYTRMLYLLLCRRLPTDIEAEILDACLVMLMEAGLNASSVVTRVTAAARPGQAQAAIAAGLLTVGERFVGSSQACGDILAAAPADPGELRDYCHAVVERLHRAGMPVPGFGHGTHRGVDPRAQRLMQIAAGTGIGATQLDALRCLGAAVNDVLGRRLVINVTGAIAALLLGIGIPPQALTAVAVVSRCGGLAAHAVEEAETHTSDALWQVLRDAVVYDGDSSRLPSS